MIHKLTLLAVTALAFQAFTTSASAHPGHGGGRHGFCRWGHGHGHCYHWHYCRHRGYCYGGGYAVSDVIPSDDSYSDDGGDGGYYSSYGGCRRWGHRYSWCHGGDHRCHFHGHFYGGHRGGHRR